MADQCEKRPENLYVHFPFCRTKCSYCALFSRTGSSPSERDGYVRKLVRLARGRYRTAYFGGGSPALCNLNPLLAAIEADEFTVELHPLDVTGDLLRTLRDGGVNRISMGVQSFDDRTLLAMNRGHTLADARRAFDLVRRHFDNAGIDLIVGYPGDTGDIAQSVGSLSGWGVTHCSVYSLQNERGLKDVPDDDFVLDRIREASDALEAIGLRRYEISNYALPGFECRHNLAVWRGEDYLGVGDGAHGRVGLKRTFSFGGAHPSTEMVTPRQDMLERTIFRLRTREGIDIAGHREWQDAFRRFEREGLLSSEGSVYRLTSRGTEVCDSILSELL